MEVVIKELSKPRLTLGADGRVTLKVPPGYPNPDRLFAFVKQVIGRAGVPTQTLRGSIKASPRGQLEVSLQSVGKRHIQLSVVEDRSS